MTDTATPCEAKQGEIIRVYPTTSKQSEEVPPARIEFAGWLPAFGWFGNCGNHPLFSHIETPPPGYLFLRSKPDAFPTEPLLLRLAVWPCWLFLLFLLMFVNVFRQCWQYGPWRYVRTLTTGFLLGLRLLWRGGRPDAVVRFLRTRQLTSQLLLQTNAEVVFLSSVPFTYGQYPWVIEIEDWITLFFPFHHNGQSSNLEIRKSPFLPILKAMLESKRCLGIITHMRSTAQSLPVLFQSEIIKRKTFCIPLGVRYPAYPQKQKQTETINVLFTNSWHQHPIGFGLRGGLEVLEAFAILKVRYPQLRLTLRSNLPELSERHLRIIEECDVRVISWFIPQSELERIQQQSQIYLLPAARIHIVSLLQAMSYGQAVVVSDGWGFDEYVTHEQNGLIVKGRKGKVSWEDDELGILREDYEPLKKVDDEVVEGIVEAVSRLVEEDGLRERLGMNARAKMERDHTIERWNESLANVFDTVLHRKR